MEIAVVGSEKFVIGFRLAGIRNTHTVNNDEELKEKINELFDDENIGIIVVMDEDVSHLPESFRKKIFGSIKPIVIAIGKIEEVELRERIKHAVGIDLWKEKGDSNE